MMNIGKSFVHSQDTVDVVAVPFDEIFPIAVVLTVTNKFVVVDAVSVVVADTFWLFWSITIVTDTAIAINTSKANGPHTVNAILFLLTTKCVIL